MSEREMYEIRYTDGRTSETETYEEAIELVRAEYPDATIGHSGDLDHGGDRTLCWADEDSSQNDDGAHAVVAIYKQVR
jgi:hypothetical protein